jgi:hypothetical protein
VRALFVLAIIYVFFRPLTSFGVVGWEQVQEDLSVVKVGEGCTGTRVSSEGHILTARHCFNGCLIAGGFVDADQLFPEYGWQSPKLYHLNQTAVCLTEIDGVEKQVEILAIGPGFMTPMEQGSLIYTAPELYNEFLEQSFFHNGDFAIIKEQTDVTSCKRDNWNDPTDGAEVFFRGFPSATTGRPNGRDSDGESLLESHGVIVGSILENSCIDKNTTNLNTLPLRYDREEILLSTVDNVPGGSGSALLNSDGEIIGLINSQYRQGIDVQSTYCSGSTVAISMRHIKSLLEETDIVNDIQVIFNCP